MNFQSLYYAIFLLVAANCLVSFAFSSKEVDSESPNLQESESLFQELISANDFDRYIDIGNCKI